MGKVNVTILDATGNKEQQATLPDDVPVRRIVAKLIDMMHLPSVDPGGQILSYKFQHKATGVQLFDEQTLAESGVKDDDVLRLLPEITAGR